jgi:hypothetical protein
MTTVFRPLPPASTCKAIAHVSNNKALANSLRELGLYMRYMPCGQADARSVTKAEENR